MSEETKTTLPVTEADEEKSLEAKEPTKKFSRREALLGALFGAGVAVAKTAEAAEVACACLAPPDCNSICAHGGTPRGDGTQACDCNPDGLATVAYTGKYSDVSGTPTIPSVATVALTGSYNDLKDKPTFTVSNIVSAGSAGGTGNVSLVAVTGSSEGRVITPPTGSISIPYFSVNAEGRITSYATRTVTLSSSNYYNYYDYDNYYAYYDTDCNDGE